MSRTPPLSSLISEQRSQVRVAESQVTAHLTASYQTRVRAALAPIMQDFADRYGRELARVRAATGDERATVSATWLHDRQGGNLPALQRAAREAVDRFAADAKTATAHGMRTMARLGAAHAADQISAALQPAAAAAHLSVGELRTRIAHAATHPKTKTKQRRSGR